MIVIMAKGFMVFRGGAYFMKTLYPSDTNNMSYISVNGGQFARAKRFFHRVSSLLLIKLNNLRSCLAASIFMSLTNS